MPTSQNGWPATTTRPSSISIPGTHVKLALREGDVAAVFLEFVTRFHHEVENLDLYKPGDEWGWAFRNVRGSHSIISNHASGTAVDLNATRHPRGVLNTFTSAQKTALRKLLKDFHDNDIARPIFRWGGDFTHDPSHGRYVDEMHIEINADSHAVKRVADRIRAKHNAHKEHEMNLSDKVTLTAAAAHAMGNPDRWKEGDEMSVAYMLLWGGPGLQRLMDRVENLEKTVSALKK